jgi:signal transduction histidine kinase
MIRRSLAGRLLGWLLPVFALAALLPLLLSRWLHDPWLVGVITLAVTICAGALATHRALSPVNALFRALIGSVNTYRDGVYNTSVYWQGDEDELTQLVRAHAQLGDVLREQRQGLAQRELLLDAMVQNTPVAMLLVSLGAEATQRIVFSNLAARQLLNGGWAMEGRALSDLLQAAPAPLRDALARGGDCLFQVPLGDDPDQGEQDTYHLARQSFRLNGQPHELYLLRRLSGELRREEMRAWRKVIRVLSHELNNSLAPVASLAHSGAELLKRGRTERLAEVFATIEERTRHLNDFLGAYARIAKLPQPSPQPVDWSALLARLRAQIPFTAQLPPEGWSSDVDPAQFEQALLNLLKNAHESGSPADEITLSVQRLLRGYRIEVRDRGQGMTQTVLQNALTPFYSTKRQGSGLGLALAREIVEAHGGRLSLHNRKGGGLCVTLELPGGPAPKA